MEWKVLTWTCYSTDCGQTLVLSLVLILSVADRVLHGAEAADVLVKAVTELFRSGQGCGYNMFTVQPL